MNENEQKMLEKYGLTEADIFEQMCFLVSEQKKKQDKEISEDYKEMTLYSWLDHWLETYRKIELEKTTYEKYRSVIDNHYHDGIGQMFIQKLTVKDIQLFINKKAKKYAPSMVKDIYKILPKAFEQAVAEGILSSNITLKVSLPKIKKTKPNLIPDEQLKRLFDVARRHRLYPALILSFGTGIRRAELLGLKWDCVDFDNNQIRIEETVVALNNGPEVKDPKNESSKRTIQVPELIMELLKDYPRVNKFVFTNKRGGILSPRTYYKVFRKWCKDAGVSTTIHNLRHMYISNLVGNGIDIPTIQSLSGHADEKTLLSVYAHPLAENRLKAANVIDENIKKLTQQ